MGFRIDYAAQLSLCDDHHLGKPLPNLVLESNDTVHEIMCASRVTYISVYGVYPVT